MGDFQNFPKYCKNHLNMFKVKLPFIKIYIENMSRTMGFIHVYETKYRVFPFHTLSLFPPILWMINFFCISSEIV